MSEESDLRQILDMRAHEVAKAVHGKNGFQIQHDFRFNTLFELYGAGLIKYHELCEYWNKSFGVFGCGGRQGGDAEEE